MKKVLLSIIVLISNEGHWRSSILSVPEHIRSGYEWYLYLIGENSSVVYMTFHTGM